MQSNHSEETPVEFTGTASSFWGLALVNLLLTIVTVGIYRFWAKTRVRRYLWSNTLYRGDPLEYRGTGLELFIGALVVVALLIVPITLIGVLGFVLKGSGLEWIANIITLVVYIGLLWLIGVALYRALRYRLSRTSWRGIRGGMTGKGWSYGTLYLKMLLLQIVTLGFASPYAATRLWNALWSDAMFGSAEVFAQAEWRPLFKRFLLSWLGVIAVYVLTLVWVFTTQADTLALLKPGAPPRDPATMMGAIGVLYLGFIAAGVVILFVLMAYHAALVRALFGGTRLDTLHFRFDATARQWIGFYLGNIAIVVVTLGFGYLIMPYRLWGFYVRHLSTVGTLDFDALAQTSLAAPGQGEGLADAFDIAPF